MGPLGVWDLGVADCLLPTPELTWDIKFCRTLPLPVLVQEVCAATGGDGEREFAAGTT